MAADARSGDRTEDAFAEPIADLADMLVVAVEVARRDLHRLAQPGDAGDVLGAGATVPLVATAGDHRLDPGAHPGVEAADPFGAVNLVGRDTEQVDSEVIDSHRDFAESLDGVGVEICPVSYTHLTLPTNR